MPRIKINIIKDLISKRDEYNFSEFLLRLREYHGYTRPFVQECTGINQVRLFYLEHGLFKRGVKELEISALSSFYDVPYLILKELADRFYNEMLGRAREPIDYYRQAS